MSRLRIAWLLVAGFAMAAAQDNLQPGPPRPAGRAPPESQPSERLREEDYCTVEGTVVDARTQAPLRKAAVVLVGGAEGARGGAGGFTDAEGRFRIEKVPPGRYRISLQRNGYAGSFGIGGTAGNPLSLTLAPGQRVRGLVLKMTPAAVITGRVIDEDGEPVAWARVNVMQYRYLGGKRQLVPVAGGTTDDRGEYRVFGRAPGRYYVSASWEQRETGLRPLAQARAANRITYPAIYYPGTAEPEQAAPVSVRAGEERHGIDFRLWPTEAATVSGRVLLPGAAQAARNVMLVVAPRIPAGFPGAVPRRFAQVDPATGRFTVTNVRPGSHVLTAVYRDGESSLFARQEIEVGGADVEGIDLVLAPGVSLEGRLEVETGGAGEVKLDGMRVLLQPEEEATRAFAGGSGRVREDGTFELRNLPPGRYAVRVLGLPEGSYLKSARLGDQEVLGSTLVLQGATGGRLRLLVSPFGGRVDGTVRDADERPAAGALVVLVPEESRRGREDLYFEQAADQNGRFSFRGVPPGEYKAFAWEKAELGAWRNPAFLERHEEDGVKISVKERAQQVAELKLLRTEEAEP